MLHSILIIHTVWSYTCEPSITGVNTMFRTMIKNSHCTQLYSLSVKIVEMYELNPFCKYFVIVNILFYWPY